LDELSGAQYLQNLIFVLATTKYVWKMNTLPILSNS
jgi:hypothetical protein